MEIRLQKLMAEAGLGSRRDNELLITAGRVTVNGTVAKLGDKADLAKDEVRVDGRRLKAQTHIYIMVYKPKGVISSLEDELDEDRPTIRDMIPLPGHLYPIGRLDKNSEGLIIMTNDGQMAHKLTHPRYEHEKSYRVLVSGKMTAANVELWRNGIELDGQMTAPAQVFIMNQQSDRTLLRVVLREGRKRQIRRVAALLGHDVLHLFREAIGPLKLEGLRPGDWRHLTAEELKALQETVQKHRARPKLGSRARPGKTGTARPHTPRDRSARTQEPSKPRPPRSDASTKPKSPAKSTHIRSKP